MTSASRDDSHQLTYPELSDQLTIFSLVAYDSVWGQIKTMIELRICASLLGFLLLA